MKKARWVMLVVGCGAVVLAVLLTGCILPGHHGGHRPPGLPGQHGGRLVTPAKNAVAATSESPAGNNSPRLVQNQNVAMLQGELYE